MSGFGAFRALLFLLALAAITWNLEPAFGQATQPSGVPAAINRGTPYVIGDCLQAASATTIQTTGAPCASGDITTASNVGSAGTGVFKQKSSTTLELYKLNSTSNLLTIGLDGTDKIDFTVNPANILLQNLGGAVTDAQVPNNITASNYLPLAGGTLSGQLVTDNLGIEFEESDTNPACSSGNFNIYADLSEGILKKCEDGVASELAGLGTVGAGATNDLACYSDTNEIVPCETGVLVRPGAGSLQLDAVTLGFSGGALTFQNATLGGATQVVIQSGDTQPSGFSGDGLTEWRNAAGSAGVVIGQFDGTNVRMQTSTLYFSYAVQAYINASELKHNRGGSGVGRRITNANTVNGTSGTHTAVGSDQTFAPTSGDMDYYNFSCRDTFNQTGTASGITRCFGGEVTLTSAVDFRFFEAPDVGPGNYSIKTGTGKIDLGGPLTFPATGAAVVNSISLAHPSGNNSFLTIALAGSGAGLNNRFGLDQDDAAMIFTNASTGPDGPTVLAIGTTDAVPLVFGTFNVARLRITGAGAIELLDPGDITKVATFDISGITGSTTRTFAFPDEDGTLLTSVSELDPANLPAAIDLGGKTSFEIPNGASPTVDAFGEIAGDNDLWAASRGAPVFFDGTAAVALVGVLVSDTPTDGQVVKWNTGGTLTWEDDSGGSASPGGSSGQVQTNDGAGGFDGDADLAFDGDILHLGVGATKGLRFGDDDTGLLESSDDVLEFHAGGQLVMNLSLAVGVQFHDVSDDTKILGFDLSGLSTSTLRTVEPPTADGVLFSLGMTLDISANTNLGATSPVALSGDDVTCPTCLVDGDIDANSGVLGIDANGDVVVPRDLTVTRNLIVGDGTAAGQLAMLELSSNGTNHRTWKVPDALTASLTMEFSDSIPSAANQVALFSDGSGGTTTVTFGDPLLEGELDSLSELNTQIADATIPQTIGGGAQALDTDEIASEACDVTTASASGVATTDVILATLNGTPVGVTGYVPDTGGTLYVYAYPTTDNVNFAVCNNTAGAITPGALTVNWKVIR